MTTPDRIAQMLRRRLHIHPRYLGLSILLLTAFSIAAATNLWGDLAGFAGQYVAPVLGVVLLTFLVRQLPQPTLHPLRSPWGIAAATLLLFGIPAAVYVLLHPSQPVVGPVRNHWCYTGWPEVAGWLSCVAALLSVGALSRWRIVPRWLTYTAIVVLPAAAIGFLGALLFVFGCGFVT